MSVQGKGRRQLLTLGALGAGAMLAQPRAMWAQAAAKAPVVRNYAQPQAGVPLVLPLDHGPHPDFRTEWWYFTGWFEAGQEALGVQITFFRSAPAVDLSNPSRFNPSQLLIAHAALALPGLQRLEHAEMVARAYPDLVRIEGRRLSKSNKDPVLLLEAPGWLLRSTDGVQWECRVQTNTLQLTLNMTQTQPPWLQGQGGFSQKGPSPNQSSHYITLPHMQARGQYTHKGATKAIEGQFWMDHEWSSTVLAPEAQGWDWVGLMGIDGSSLMAFQIRHKEPGKPPVWTHACLREANGKTHTFKKVEFVPLKNWRSPRNGVSYPVAQLLRLDGEEYELTPLFEDQELDSRSSTGTVYWEGAVQVQRKTSTLSSSPWGQGYLELTGYGRPMTL